MEREVLKERIFREKNQAISVRDARPCGSGAPGNFSDGVVIKETIMTVMTALSKSGKATMTDLFAWSAANPGKISRRGNSRRTVAYVPKDHAAFGRFAGELKPSQIAVSGVIVVEWMEPHPEPLSVTGVYLSSSDGMAPRHKCLWAVAKTDGTPDLDHITRDGGGLAKAMRHLWE